MLKGEMVDEETVVVMYLVLHSSLDFHSHCLRRSLY